MNKGTQLKLIYKLISLFTLSTSFLCSHTLWINSQESFVYEPAHTSVSLGWGHNIPIDDMLNSQNGKVVIKEFSISSPSGTKTSLRVPSASLQEASIKANDFDVYDSDIALQKVSFKKTSEKGVYTLEAKSKQTHLTKYIDTKDRKRLKFTSIDKVKRLKEVIESLRTTRIAKTYFTIGAWKQPKALNKGLEIIPLSDLSKVKVGDTVEFKVLFYGKNIKAKEPLMASSSNFKTKDKYEINKKIKKGKAKIKVTSKGQWIVSVHHKENVKDNISLKYLENKVTLVNDITTLTFNVK